MQCVICSTNLGQSFQYMNENCVCDTKNIEHIYNKFFGNGGIFLSNEVLENIRESIKLIEKEIRNKNSIKTNGGVLMSYDFHLDGNIPKLIEINTNAGGVFLNYKLLQLTKTCCNNAKIQDTATFESKIVEMFRTDYLLKNNKKENLKTVAIMDENVKEQFLYPELIVCKEILEKNGIKTYIIDSKDIEVIDGVGYFNCVKIDLIYNRNTDFYFFKEENKKFLEILKNSQTVISPAPNDYLVYADKKNLVSLSQNEMLKNIIPKTHLVHKDNEVFIWNHRKEFFFKPINGYGGRGSYNGNGLTKKVWGNIINSEYVAQEIVVPSSKIVKVDNQNKSYKFDIRAYTYNGEVLLFGARVYQGQTTNFRTSGGGFMPIFFTKN